MELNNIDEILAAQERGELPNGVRAIDMRDARLAVIVHNDGSVFLKYWCQLADVVEDLRDLANVLENRLRESGDES